MLRILVALAMVGLLTGAASAIRETVPPPPEGQPYVGPVPREVADGVFRSEAPCREDPVALVLRAAAFPGACFPIGETGRYEIVDETMLPVAGLAQLVTGASTGSFTAEFCGFIALANPHPGQIHRVRIFPLDAEETLRICGPDTLGATIGRIHLR